jgi:hypothetical protein
MDIITKKRSYIDNLHENRNKYRAAVTEATQILNTTEYNILRKQILSPVDLHDTYLGVLPKDILHNHLYQYINFDLTYFEGSVVCPHGHYIKPRIWKCDTRSEYYNLIYCHHCNCEYLFAINTNPHMRYVYKCLFVVKLISQYYSPLTRQLITYNNKSYQVNYTPLFGRQDVLITFVRDGNIEEIEFHT